MCVQTSLVYVTRGMRGAIWGCVYLDAHGEEDRELKYAIFVR
jgi:hypothetical protein